MMPSGNMPQLDGPPPPQSGVNPAQPPQTPATFNGMAPPPSPAGGDMELVAMKLQLSQAVAEGLQKLGQIDPSLGTLSAQLMSMLRDGVRTSLQQGLATPESSQGPQSSFSQMAGMGMESAQEGY